MNNGVSWGECLGGAREDPQAFIVAVTGLFKSWPRAGHAAETSVAPRPLWGRISPKHKSPQTGCTVACVHTPTQHRPTNNLKSE